MKQQIIPILVLLGLTYLLILMLVWYIVGMISARRVTLPHPDSEGEAK